MDEADIRRSVLRTLIDQRFDGVDNQFAIAVGKPAGQINDMLAKPPRKSFGSRIAREFENKLNLGKFYFEDLANACHGNVAKYESGPSSSAPQGVAEEVADYLSLTSEERELLNGFRNAPDEVRRHLVNSVREYIRNRAAA